jgi:hypothetical protein
MRCRRPELTSFHVSRFLEGAQHNATGRGLFPAVERSMSDSLLGPRSRDHQREVA